MLETQDHRHFTEEHEDLRVKHLFFHHPSMASTFDSAESPVSDSHDEQIRVLLASSLSLQEREANAKRSQVCHSEREHLMSSSSQDPISTGKLVALFSSKNGLNQEAFSDRKDGPFTHQQVFGSNELFFIFSNSANVTKSVLDGNGDHLLAS